MRKKLLYILLICLAWQHASGQKVGLVLSGGGAKGLYHIGVIMALEENGIPIDYISGTSMGSIIGGLYAAGMTPEQMKKEFISDKVNYWITGKIEDQYQYYFKQMHQDASMLTIRIDPLNMKTVMPTNLIPSNQIDMAFINYFSSAQQACGGNFDSLMVPFRCVATDAVKRREVIHSHGDIGRAIRTSMTIPFVFRPIRNDSTVMYDGGLYNNFPWQVLDQQFNPDIIIGSKCVEGNSLPEHNSVMDQVFALTMMHTDYTLPKEKGIMIDHIFSNVSMLDFSRSEYIIQTGYDDAMAKMDQINERIHRRVDTLQMSEKRDRFHEKMPPLLFGGYTVTGLSEKQQTYVRKLIKLDDDTTFTLDRFKSQYFKILAEGEIEGDYPDVSYNRQTGLFDLSINMQTKPSLKLKVGGNISSTALNQAYIGLEYRNIGKSAHIYNLDGYYSPFYVSTAISARTDFFMGIPFYYMVGASYNYYNYFRSDYGVVSRSSDISYAKYEDSYMNLTFGTPLGRYSVLSLQGNAGIDNYNYAPSNKVYERGDKLDRTRFDFVGLKLEVERNNVNYHLYPTRGILQSLSGIAVSGAERFYPGTASGGAGEKPETSHRYWLGARFTREHFFPVPSIKWFSWGYLLDITLTNHADFENANATNITSPAFTPTQHSKVVYMKEFRAASYVGAGITPTFEFAPNFYIQVSAYTFLPDNYNGEKMDVHRRLRYMFDTSLVYQTMIGPVSLSLSKYDTNKNNWFITFNFGWALFNKKGLFY